MQKAEDKTILVVEDEPDVQVFMKAALEDAGFNVIAASNGHDAYNMLKTETPDFITLDLVMPRQSGILFYKKFRKREKWAHIPVLIVTAHARDDLGQEDFDELMKGEEFPSPDAYLEKPVKRDVLIRKVAEMLDVDVSSIIGDAADDTRADIISKIAGMDLQSLKKVQEALKKDR